MALLLSDSEQRGLFFHIEVEECSLQPFVVTRFEIKECVSEPLSGTFHVAIRDRDRQRGDIDTGEVIDHKVICRFYEDGQEVRVIAGVCSGFAYRGEGEHYTHYELTLHAAIYRLGLRHNSRIFQDCSVPDIIATLLQERGIEAYVFSLRETHQKREYCVQYQESDLAFLQRLCAEEGIVFISRYHHDHQREALLFFDHIDSTIRHENAMMFNHHGGLSRQMCIWAWREEMTVCSSSVLSRDYHFSRPHHRYQQESLSAPLVYQREDYEYYDYPGRYQQDETGKRVSQYRFEQLRRDSHLGRGEGNVMRLGIGQRFDLVGHPHGERNRLWLSISVAHFGTQSQALEDDGSEGETSYYNEFTCIPGDRMWRGQVPVKPRVDGPQIGTVVGPEGEDIFCDEYGRVKVHFPWDRESCGNAYSSCWIRVSQGWAGGQYGMMAIPRVGHEVIVDFLNGDPDRPIITGRTYHDLNQPPYELPTHKTRTVLRTSSDDGKGANELRFEDKGGAEEIYLHGQRDMVVSIGHARREDIRHDSEHEIGHDALVQVNGDNHLTVDGEWRQQIKGQVSQEVLSSAHLKQRDSLLSEAGNEVHMKAGAKVVIEAGAEITLKVGGSFVKLDSAGVHIGGVGVQFNAGGRAGSGRGYGGRAPLLPGGVETPPELETNRAVLEQQVLMDIQHAMPITQTCQRDGNKACPLTECPCGRNK